MKDREMETRSEDDSLGSIAIHLEALWGTQTQRAIENFPISGLRFDRDFISALGYVKQACARQTQN
jgi:fumarate hydratase class II